MNHRLLTCLLVFALLLTMAGCSAAGLERKLDAAEDRVEEKLDAVEDSIEDSLRDAMPARPSAPAAAPADPAAAASVPVSAEPITKEEAEQIALDHAGFTADQVQRLYTEFEIDDGTRQYDVQFHEGDWEYEFEISAETGKILSYDKDHKYD